MFSHEYLKIAWNSEEYVVTGLEKCFPHDIVIPEGVTELCDCAFRGCTGLTSIVIPNSVKQIGYNVFKGCTGLTSIVLPDSIEQIGDSAFEGCTELTSINIPRSLVFIENRVFSYCTGLTSVIIPNNVMQIGDSAFEGCTGLTSINIPNSVREIGDYAFYGCTGLTTLKIPKSIPKNEIVYFWNDPSRKCKFINSATAMRERIKNNECYLNIFRDIMNLDFMKYLSGVEYREGNMIGFSIQIALNDADCCLLHNHNDSFEEYATRLYGYSRIITIYESNKGVKDNNVAKITFFF